MKRKHGVTLIELVIVMTLITVIGSLITVFIVKGLDIWVFYRDSYKAQAKARLTMTKIIRETRNMRALNRQFDQEFYVEEKSFAFTINIPPDADPIDQNKVGFVLLGAPAKNLIFFDKFAARPAPFDTRYGDDFKAPHTGNVINLMGIDVLKFDLANTVTDDFRFEYYGVNLGDGNITKIDLDLAPPTPRDTFLDPNWPSPRSSRLIKVGFSVEEVDKTFPLVTVVKMRNDIQ
ncbi:MAG: prepilin-type N-terminal cleavage/methylation domain-containing protein [Candidatus Saganbacteria bacterium]|nr:prepilin-type N-terminal cleavage/methylation domain-containing protein [Candidatus Saganbacteria bacterium]